MATQEFQPVMILRARASADIPAVGLKAGESFYLARDGEHYRAVKWDRVRWVCSCGQGACEHKLAVNEFVFEQSQQSRTNHTGHLE